MIITNPTQKISPNVAELFDSMSKPPVFGDQNQTQFEWSFDLYVRYSIADYNGGLVTKLVSEIKDISSKSSWDRLAKSLFQIYALENFEITRAKLMKDFIGNLSDQQNSWLQQKIIGMVKYYFQDN